MGVALFAYTTYKVCSSQAFFLFLLKNHFKNLSPKQRKDCPMGLLSDLQNSEPTLPPYAKILKQIPPYVLAEHIGASYAWTNSILSGRGKPSKELNKRFQDLADRIEAEQAELENA